MKAIIKIFILSVVLSSITWIAPQKVAAQVSVSVDFQVFYDDLNPYGNWVDNSDYGYVWVPNVSRGFTPYGTNGYWVFTEDGWTWVSNYSWGWAPFHYGRWFFDSYYGWVWVPDNEWGPGWVIWRRSEGYYGWAPIGPGISIDFAYSSGYNLPYDRWRFVRDRDFGRRDINNYYVNTTNYTTIINNSTVINNFREDRTRNLRYNEGPDRTEVERRAGKTFTPVAIKESNRPAQILRKDQLEMYRPQVQKNVTADRKPAPSRVQSWKKDQQPTQQQPIRQQPPRQQPTQQQPIRQQPPRQQPTQQQPIRQQPPTRQNPTREQPVKQHQPIKEQPPKQPPTRVEPTKRPPTKDQPTKQPTKKEQPPKQQPTKDHPKKKGKG